MRRVGAWFEIATIQFMFHHLIMCSTSTSIENLAFTSFSMTNSGDDYFGLNSSRSTAEWGARWSFELHRVKGNFSSIKPIACLAGRHI